MRIIQTINYGCDEKKICEAIDVAKKNKVHGIRFNLCKFFNDELEEAISFLGRIMQTYRNDFEFSIDLPYPCNKVRILTNSLESSEVIEGKKYKIISNGKNGDIVVSCDEFSLYDSGSLIYYADGEGAFEVIESTRNEILVKALKTFSIWNGKAVSCGLLDADDNIYEMISRLGTLNLGKKLVLFLSFVKDAKEVTDFKERIDMDRFIVVSKVESVSNIYELDKIINASDGILLARGDMAIYMSQFNPLKICRQISRENIGKRLFAATDILLGLQDSFLPSRAEIMDYFLLMELGCTDIVLANYLRNSERLYKYIRESADKT